MSASAEGASAGGLARTQGDRTSGSSRSDDAGVEFDALPVAVARLRSGGRIVAVNDAWEPVTGTAASEVLGRRWLAELDVLQRSVVESRLEQAIEDGEAGQSDWRVGGRWTRWRWAPSVRDDGSAELVICVVDIDDDKTREGELWYRATHDPLTGLVNRNEFLGLVQRALDRRGRTERAVAVIFADLVGFKQVNDRGGHLLGDGVLRTVAGHLGGVIRPADVLARIGGDEFAVLCEDLGGSSEAADVAARLRDVVAGVDHPDAGTSLRLSTGIAVADDGDVRAEELLARADTAMYAARGIAHEDPMPDVPTRRAAPYAPLTLVGGTDGGGDRPEALLPIEVAETVIQRIYGIGLHLAAATSLARGPVKSRLQTAIEEFDDLIREVRQQVFAGAVHGSEPTDTLASTLDLLADIEQLLSSMWLDMAGDVELADTSDRLVQASRHVHRAIVAISPTSIA